MKYASLGLLLLFSSLSLYTVAQDVPNIEGLLEGNDIPVAESGYEEMVNTLLNFINSPLNINTADFDSLKMLFLLSDGQIDQLLVFRKKSGNFMHVRELLLVPGIGRRDLENILPFITIGKPSFQNRLSTLKTLTKQEILGKVRMNVPFQEGYKHYHPEDFNKKQEYERKLENRFQGFPVGTLVKYKLLLNKQLQIGLTLENDPGEAYFTKNQKMGFDFLSTYFCLMTTGFFRKVILGDYRLQWGQGLLAWGGFSSGKSDVAVGNEKSGKGLLPYSSTDENNYLRGVALKIQPLPELSAELFFSKKKTDGNLTAADTLSEEDWLTVSLYESGYHRNWGECRKKHMLEEWTTGFSLQWNTAYFKLGGNFLYYDFRPVLIPGDRIYQQYNDTGKKRCLFSLDYKTAFRNIYVFGETAFTNQGSFATVDGLRWSTSFVSSCLIYRRYEKTYVSHYAAGFGEYSNTSNEEGVYLGADFSLFRQVKMNIYYDWFRFFSPRYRATLPKSGYEILGEATYHQQRLEHRFRVKYERKPEDVKGIFSAARCKTEYRYQVNYKYARLWEGRIRLSGMHYRKEKRKEWGYMIYQDLIYTSRNNLFKMQYRLGWFDTDSYESRIYAYENNVLYGYSFPAFMKKGWRTYLNLTWKPVKGITFYLKSGLTVYPGQETISSGLTKVDGNRVCDFTLQLKVNI